MNIIVANKNSSILNSLDIDIIKSLNGEFAIAEIVQLFSNFFFEKIIIDITAIKDVEDQSQLSYLTANIEPNKIIIKSTTFLAFNHNKDVYLENLQKRINISDLQEYIKSL